MFGVEQAILTCMLTLGLAAMLRATVGFGDALAVLTSHGLAGVWTPRVLGVFVFSAPLIALGTFLGTRLARRILPEQFSRIVYWVLVAVGVLFIFSPLERR